jgi:hypothetical protein
MILFFTSQFGRKFVASHYGKIPDNDALESRTSALLSYRPASPAVLIDQR